MLQLEAQLGARLVGRSTRRFRITGFGRLVLAHAEEVAARTAAEVEPRLRASGRAARAGADGLPDRARLPGVRDQERTLYLVHASRRAGMRSVRVVLDVTVTGLQEAEPAGLAAPWGWTRRAACSAFHRGGRP